MGQITKESCFCFDDCGTPLQNFDRNGNGIWDVYGTHGGCYGEDGDDYGGWNGWPGPQFIADQACQAQGYSQACDFSVVSDFDWQLQFDWHLFYSDGNGFDYEYSFNQNSACGQNDLVNGIGMNGVFRVRCE